MNWVTWLIPVIALAVWILVNLLKVPQDRDKPPARRPPPQPPRNNPAANAQRTDLDRFLEEANRRRRQQEQQRKASRSPTLFAEPGGPEKSLEPNLQRVRPERGDGARPVPPPLPSSQPIPVIPVVRPARAAQSATVVPVRADAGARPPAEVVPAYKPGSVDAHGFTTPPTSQSAYTQQRRPGQLAGSAAARDVLHMLKDANSARAAIILREILDRPVAMRRRRRG